MKNTLNIVFGIINTFLLPFVGYKIYGWYYQEVGFDLPALNYLNLFAIFVIIRLFTMDVGNSVMTINIHNREENDNILSLTISIVYLIALGSAYIYKLILF